MHTEGQTLPHGKEYPSRWLTTWPIMLLHLAGLALVIHWFDIEPTLHLQALILVVIGAFALQSLIPERWRIWLFIGASLIGLQLFVGWNNALIVITGVLLAITGISVARKKAHRNGILIGIFTVLAAAFLANPAIIQDHFMAFSTLGSIFLFRLTLFVYEKNLHPGKSAPDLDLAYFFMLPNMAIPLFPAVDYKTFATRYSAGISRELQFKGFQWISLGIFHLMIYRIIYHMVVLPASDVTDLSSFLHHATSNYALVLRLSGLFHTAVGILCLFGFNLPPTFNNYFLASGFSDLWRRLNIYYRDFLLKTFYYPLYFTLRKAGILKATIASILILFSITWFIHSLQWLFLKGDFPIALTDLIYWGIFGVLISLHAAYDLRRKKSKKEKTVVQHAAILSLKILLTFTGMSILWSLWSANSIGIWTGMVHHALHSPISDYLRVGGIFLALWIVVTLGHLMVARYPIAPLLFPASGTRQAYRLALGMTAGLLAFHIPMVREYCSATMRSAADKLYANTLTVADEQQQVEGYYTDILMGTGYTTPLADQASPKAHQFRNTKGAILVFDHRGVVMRPNTSYQFKGKDFSINRWGGRDKDYDLVAPPNTVRAVLTGGSFVAGSGVQDAEVFDVILEDRMNEASDDFSYEFMNFGCPSYDLIDVIIQIEEDKLFKLQPDYLFYFSQGRDFHKNIKDIAQSIRNNIPLTLPYLSRIILESEVQADMSEQDIIQALQPFGDAIIEESYTHLYQLCNRYGVRSVWIYWPSIVENEFYLPEKEKSKAFAENAGWFILDLADLYEGFQAEELKVASNDNHPNALGHKLLADELFKAFHSTLLLENLNGEEHR
jgi:D-alanyl-lipoteichoic acid acyltransferase DltB (MBOAT superfamily)